MADKTSSEDFWFSSTVVLTAGFGALTLFINAYKWRTIRDSLLTNSKDIGTTDQEVVGLFWLNAIFGILLLAVFVWAIMRMYMSKKVKVVETTK